MPNDLEVPSHLNIRIDPQLRYLTELAARHQGITITAYVEELLWKSFRSIFPLEERAGEITSLAEKQKQLMPPNDSLAAYADGLWSENPGVRLELLTGVLEHLMSDEEKKIRDYIFDSKKYSSQGRMNQKAVAENWHQIKHDALSSSAPKGHKK